MFVYTAKCSRRKLGLILILGLAAVIVLVLVCAGGAAGAGAKAETDVQRIAYLESFGWQVGTAPLEQQEIRIPATLEGVYAEYAQLQTAQGFHLERFCSMDATRYTYSVQNYPDAPGNVVADLLVCDGRIIAGDIQCVSADGFMLPLDPKLANQTPS